VWNCIVFFSALLQYRLVKPQSHHDSVWSHDDWLPRCRMLDFGDFAVRVSKAPGKWNFVHRIFLCFGSRWLVCDLVSTCMLCTAGLAMHHLTRHLPKCFGNWTIWLELMVEMPGFSVCRLRFDTLCCAVVWANYCMKNGPFSVDWQIKLYRHKLSSVPINYAFLFCSFHVNIHAEQYMVYCCCHCMHSFFCFLIFKFFPTSGTPFTKGFSDIPHSYVSLPLKRKLTSAAVVVKCTSTAWENFST